MTPSRFAFATAGRVLFGPGSATEIPGAVASLGQRVLVVTGRHPGRFSVVDALAETGADLVRLQVGGEPSVDDARAAIESAQGCHVVLGLGGGSVLDLAKTAGALVSAADPLDHLEVVGRGSPLPATGLPVVAVPTTAGTGSEVTANAVLSATDERVKVSLRGPTVLPRVAIVDPLLTLPCSPAVTASSGLDALIQCLEPYVSPYANPLTDGFAKTGLRAAGRSLRTAYLDGENRGARADMALASLSGGLALANAKLGAVHGIAGVVGAVTGGPHGAICAALLPSVITVTMAALRSRDPGSPAMRRYALAADLVTAGTASRAEDLVAWVRETCQLLSAPGLGAYGLSESDIDHVVVAAGRSSSMRGHPIELTQDELRLVVQSSR